MLLLDRYTDVPAQGRGAVLALGNFDGVHRGHQAVIGEARRVAAETGAPLGVLTFEPHPRSFFDPNGEPFRLTPPAAKRRHLAALGLDVLYELPFDRAFSRLPAERFVQEVLVEGIGAGHVVAGYDFVFGHCRQGTLELLTHMADSLGFGLTVVSPESEPGGRVYSSTQIRELLQSGHPAEAGELLGHHWEIEGEVVAGEKLGRTLGFPTANLQLGEYLRPAFGVYAVRAGLANDGEPHWMDGAANLGLRPTVGGDGVLLEVYAFDFAGDIYGRTLRVRMVEFLRPEEKFVGLEAMRVQMEEDCRQARRILARGEEPPAADARQVTG